MPPWQADYLEWRKFKAQEETLTFPIAAQKNLYRGPVPGIELCWDSCRVWARCSGGNARDQSPLCVLLSLHDPANIYLPNIVFSIFTWIAFLPSEVPKHYPQHPLLSLVEDGIWGEGFGLFGKLLRFPGSLLCIHGIKLLFDFLLLICVMSI